MNKTKHILVIILLGAIPSITLANPLPEVMLTKENYLIKDHKAKENNALYISVKNILINKGIENPDKNLNLISLKKELSDINQNIDKAIKITKLERSVFEKFISNKILFKQKITLNNEDIIRCMQSNNLFNISKEKLKEIHTNFKV